MSFPDEAVESGGLLFPEGIDPEHSPQRHRAWREELFESEWVSYAKKPFGGKDAGLAYLARYAYRVEISNDRLLRLEGDRVHFRYKDYADGGAGKETSLEALEFPRRYLVHVPPPAFHRIRYYGLFATRCRAANLERCRALLGVEVPKASAERETEDWEEQLAHRRRPDAVPGMQAGSARLPRDLDSPAAPIRGSGAGRPGSSIGGGYLRASACSPLPEPTSTAIGIPPASLGRFLLQFVAERHS